MRQIEVVLDIDEDVLDQAERKATNEGRTLAEVVTELLTAFVARTEDVEDAEGPGGN